MFVASEYQPGFFSGKILTVKLRIIFLTTIKDKIFTTYRYIIKHKRVRFMEFNATLNNISVISWR
jgi:hypothetical protein